MKNKIIVQVYEIQTPDEAERMISLGVDHIGTVLLPREKSRNQPVKDTINLVRESGAVSSLIPLYNEPERVFKTLDYYQPDIVHFCENLINTDKKDLERLLILQCEIKSRYPDIKIMRSIPIAPSGFASESVSLGFADIFKDMSDYFLTDTIIPREPTSSSDYQPVNGFVGITGQTCDWQVARKLVLKSSIPVVLAGGISPENVYNGIIEVRPFGVDSCTRTNSVDPDGNPVRFKKDDGKVERFVTETARAEKEIFH